MSIPQEVFRWILEVEVRRLIVRGGAWVIQPLGFPQQTESGLLILALIRVSGSQQHGCPYRGPTATGNPQTVSEPPAINHFSIQVFHSIKATPECARYLGQGPIPIRCEYSKAGWSFC